MHSPNLDQLRLVFAELTAANDWGVYQTPRNMALALMGRVGAASSLLQFSSDDDLTTRPASKELRAELADALVFLMALADALGFDVLEQAVKRVREAVESSTQSA